MFIEKDALIKLDDSSKDLIITGEFALYKTDIEGLEYVIVTDKNNFFGIDASGTIKKHFTELLKSHLLERVFLKGKLTNAISMNISF
ncbi:MAG: hypothetical protein E6Q33_02440 [Neisseriales bacterium]|nr:MAG: hypothetical protein E6Q33_02440 [Neisseriales bacterium]